MNKWILGARLRTLPAAIAPVLVATSLARDERNLQRALLALGVSLLLQIGVNFANDYSDGVRGSDDNRIGPTRLVASGLASAKSVKTAAVISFLLAALLGLLLALQTTLWITLVGAFALLAAWGYTGGKRPYGYSGFGEASVFIFFGLVATIGTFYVQTETITFKSAVVAIPIGALSCAILAVNNLRDRALDEIVGKRTLAVRLGDRKARIFVALLLFVAHATALVTPWSLLTLVLLPISIGIAREVLTGAAGTQLIRVLGKTGKLQLIFATTFAAALAL